MPRLSCYIRKKFAVCIKQVEKHTGHKGIGNAKLKVDSAICVPGLTVTLSRVGRSDGVSDPKNRAALRAAGRSVGVKIAEKW